MEKYGDTDFVTDIKIRRLRWLGHIQRMRDERAVNVSKPGGSTPRRRPRRRCQGRSGKDESI